MHQKRRMRDIFISLFMYDIVMFILCAIFLWYLYKGSGTLDMRGLLIHSAIAAVMLFLVRIGGRVYRQIWRYGGIQCYLRLLICDTIAFAGFFLVERMIPMTHIGATKALAFFSVNTLFALSVRMVYRYAYKYCNQDTRWGKIFRWMLNVFGGGRIHAEKDPHSQKIKAAIIGAGSVGVGLAEDLLANPKAELVPRCFIDLNPDKVGRDIHNLPVYSADEATLESLKDHQIQEVIFAVPGMRPERRAELYEYYKKLGFGVKIFDYPSFETPSSKRRIREFAIEDLLFRKEKDILEQQTVDYYTGKKILITGGGGSIGSELCRQIAKMKPKQMIIVDICENTSYELQQSLLFAYKGEIDLKVEIVSITNKRGLARVYEEYRPEIVIHAAAHKHVPLMEKNCIEAVENNVFGTLNVVSLCEEYGVERFMMVSTDKAVNPTNIMGATKRVCEMIMQAYSTRGKVRCSATRFGNVLGSAGSVIPLFRRQIEAGGPITVTDRRIIRYFMTIPEASQLVLTSGAMARNGDLFVLDMGNPVKIWDLASSMIRMSGRDDIEIIETGLRPGEKLYEELLVKKEVLEKTDNDQIFIEHEVPTSMEELQQKLKVLRAACDLNDDSKVREAMMQVVPTYHRPEEVNEKE